MKASVSCSQINAMIVTTAEGLSHDIVLIAFASFSKKDSTAISSESVFAFFAADKAYMPKVNALM